MKFYERGTDDVSFSYILSFLFKIDNKKIEMRCGGGVFVFVFVVFVLFLFCFLV